MDKLMLQDESASSNPLNFSRHAQARMCQRGLTKTDVEFVRKVGEWVDDGYVMTNSAVDQRIHELRHEMNRIEKLRGVALIEGANIVITVYRADHRRICRLRGKQ